MTVTATSQSAKIGTPANLHRAGRGIGTLRIVLAAMALVVVQPNIGRSQTVTWSGGNMTWTQPDSDSWTSATYNIGNTAVFAGSGAGTVTISGTVTPGQINVTAGSYTFSGGVIDGSGGIGKSGTGTLTLTGANLYSGTTTVSAGVLNIQNATALGSTAAGTVVTADATLELQGGITVSGETFSAAIGTSGSARLNNVSGTNTWAGNISIAGSGTDNSQSVRIAATGGKLILSGSILLTGSSGTGASIGFNTGNVDVTGNISGGASGIQSFFRTGFGTGTVALSGTNTYAGFTSIGHGPVAVQNGSAIPDTSLVSFYNSNGSLVLLSNETIGSLISGSIATGATVSLNANTLTINSDPAAPSDPYGNGAAGAFWGGITGSGGIVKIGSGTLTLRGASNYTGGTTLNAGMLSLKGNGSLATTAPVNVTASGATFDISGITASGLTIGSLSGSAGSVVTLGGKALTVGDTTSTTFAGGIGGTGSLTKISSGTLTLTGSSSYSGATSITTGVINIQNASALGSTAAGTVVTADATLQLQGGITVSGETFSAAIGTSGSARLNNVSGTNTWAGNISIAGSGTDNSQSVRIAATGGKLILSGSILLTGSSGTGASIGFNTGNVDVTGNISGGASGIQSFFRTGFGTGTVALSGTNTYAGFTSIGHGPVAVQNGSAIPDTSLVSFYNSNGSLVLLSNETIGSLISGSIATGATVSLNANTLTINSDPAAPSDPYGNGAAGAFWGGITGSGGIVKTGSGRLTLNNATTYSGATTISGGTLALGANGTIGSSPTIRVGDAGSSGAVLDLTAKTGTFAFTSGQAVGGIGTINIGSGKTISSAGLWAPGNSIGSNAVTGNLSLSGTSQFELGTPGTSTSAPGTSDFTAVSGTLTLGGSLTLLDNAGADGNGSVGGGVYRLFTYSAVSGSYASVTTNPSATTVTGLGNISYGGSGTSAGQGVFLTVYDRAVASFGSGPTALTTLTLDFLSVNQGDSVSPQNFSLYNLLQTAGFTADLALLSITPGLGNTDALSTNLSLFNSLASGTFNSYQATVNTSNQGTFTNTWTLSFKSSNANAIYSGDSTQTLTLTTNVIIVPEPGALALAGLGIAAAAWAFRRRR